MIIKKILTNTTNLTFLINFLMKWQQGTSSTKDSARNTKWQMKSATVKTRRNFVDCLLCFILYAYLIEFNIIPKVIQGKD